MKLKSRDQEQFLLFFKYTLQILNLSLLQHLLLTIIIKLNGFALAQILHRNHL